MPSLKTDGFQSLILDVAEKARFAPDAAKVAQIALTLDDRFPEESGLAALTPADRVVVEWILRSGAGLADGADCLFLTPTGRLAVRFDAEPEPPGALLIAGLTWGGAQATVIKGQYRSRREDAAQEIRSLHADLAREPTGRISGRLDRIEYAVRHMAPVLIYVNDRLYSNLGKFSNLPGKSLGAGHQRSVLNQLRGIPVADWAPDDACFVACLDVLLASGPPVRAEEFNGSQLLPGPLARFLAERIALYGGVPGSGQAPADLADLAALAARCSQLRRQATASGKQPYRIINGLTLHKREHLMTTPTTLGQAPPLVQTHLSRLLQADLPADKPIGVLAPRWAELAAVLRGTAVPAGFSSPFEGVLHAFLSAIAEAFSADVSMSRGPQEFGPLRTDSGAGADPLLLRTGDFYCCVAPRRAFVERFGDDRQGLVRTLCAYSARMRFNTWHYLPHTLGIVEREPGREDWFFAPTMPDMAEWSDQHHTGHVTFGVRYAIRVPISIDYDGRPLPGLYDLRVMRAGPPPFSVADLRGAIAAALLLQQLYQAMSAYEPSVTDFSNTWYESFHG